MNKSILFTILGLLLSGAIIFGGWFIVNRLIETRSASLFALTEVRSHQVMAPPMNEGLWEYRDLSTEEIRSIFASWENSHARVLLHEPTEEQIDIAQAIEIGRNALLEVSEALNIPSEIMESTQITISLAQNIPQHYGGEMLDPRYSYWTFQLLGMVRAHVQINAVTGEVWNLSLTLPTFHHEQSSGFEQETVLAQRYVPVSAETCRELLYRVTHVLAEQVGLYEATLFVSSDRENVIYAVARPGEDGLGVIAVIHLDGRTDEGLGVFQSFRLSLFLSDSSELFQIPYDFLNLDRPERPFYN